MNGNNQLQHQSPEAFVRDLFEVCKRNSGEVSGSRAASEIKSLLKRNNISVQELVNILEKPEKFLGSFSQLPGHVCRSMSESALYHVQEAYYLTSRITRFLAHGPVFILGRALVSLGWKWNGQQIEPNRTTRLGRWVILLARLSSKAFLKFFRFSVLYRSPFFLALWKYCSLDPGRMVFDYVEEIPVDPRLGPVFHCKDKNITGTCLIGIDFLSSGKKFYYLESNLNPGHQSYRLNLDPGGDPVALKLFARASDHGYRRVCFFPHSIDVFLEREVQKAWEETARKYNIIFQVVEDPVVGSPWQRQRSFFVDLDQGNMLVVNGRYVVSPLSLLIAEKGLLDREIRQSAIMLGDVVRLQDEVLAEDHVPEVTLDSIFPNIIMKDKRFDQAKGITLFKSTTLPEQCAENNVLCYKFVEPDTMIMNVQGKQKKFVTSFRTYLLVTPDGPCYLGAKKNISTIPLPEKLAMGKVNDIRPYIAHVLADGYSVAVTDEEDMLCREATMGLGRAISGFIQRKISVHPGHC
ncbi:hypothetical protein [Desulfonatronovibrio hydrogenovorans]|uniref:hypothetical protein n=1 Tax=Desulfonatronovibrio hydrogenovorans TaxID=53245 RepID=UPI00048AB5F3|nr:hypothetical protein [Desulfonatronovibrio hydrogenovorans]